MILMTNLKCIVDVVFSVDIAFLRACLILIAHFVCNNLLLRLQNLQTFLLVIILFNLPILISIRYSNFRWHAICISDSMLFVVA